MVKYSSRWRRGVGQPLATALKNPGPEPSDLQRVETLKSAARSRHKYKKRLALQKLREMSETEVSSVRVVADPDERNK